MEFFSLSVLPHICSFFSQLTHTWKAKKKVHNFLFAFLGEVIFCTCASFQERVWHKCWDCKHLSWSEKATKKIRLETMQEKAGKKSEWTCLECIENVFYDSSHHKNLGKMEDFFSFVGWRKLNVVLKHIHFLSCSIFSFYSSSQS